MQHEDSTFRKRQRLPAPVMIASGIGVVFFLFPMLGLIARAPWTRAIDALTSAFALDALGLSAAVASASVILSAVLGVPLAWFLARSELPARGVVRALITVPMVLPPVVAGLSLLSAFGRRGLLGGALEAGGVQLPFTVGGAIVAATFVSAPFLILALEAGFASLDPDLEDAARTLGAGEGRVFRTVTLPGLRPALLAGGALAFARSLGEFGATITFAGNLQGRTQTAPLAIFELFQSDPGAAVILSLVMLLFSFVLILILRARLDAP